MEEVEVTARFGPQGKITPLNIKWKGRVHQVESTGRQWKDEDGWHILIMLAGERVFELVLTLGDGIWRINAVRDGKNLA